MLRLVVAWFLEVKVASKRAVLVGHVLRDHAVNVLWATDIVLVPHLVLDTVLTVGLRAVQTLLPRLLQGHRPGQTTSLPLILGVFHRLVVNLKQVRLVILSVSLGFARGPRPEVLGAHSQLDVRDVVAHLLELQVRGALALLQAFLGQI